MQMHNDYLHYDNFCCVTERNPENDNSISLLIKEAGVMENQDTAQESHGLEHLQLLLATFLFY